MLEPLGGFCWCGYFFDDVRNIRRVKARTFHDAILVLTSCLVSNTLGRQQNYGTPTTLLHIRPGNKWRQSRKATACGNR